MQNRPRHRALPLLRPVPPGPLVARALADNADAPSGVAVPRAVLSTSFSVLFSRERSLLKSAITLRPRVDAIQDGPSASTENASCHPWGSVVAWQTWVLAR